MVTAGEHAIGDAAARLDHARSRLRLLSPAALVEQGFLRVDDLANRLGGALRSTVQDRRHRLAEARSLLAQRSPERRVQVESHRLLALWKRLQAASPKSVLNRGFVIMRDEAGQPIAKRQGVTTGQKLSAEFGDGTLSLRAE
jgi:exodeoxyribonuclease VII large subunit